MSFAWLCKDGVIIRKLDSCLCCISLALGTKVIIVYSMVLFLFQETMYVYRFINVENGRAKCDSLTFIHDHLCDIFNGRISIFSAILIVLDTMFSLLICITGILTWTKRFQVQTLEWFFYAYFIVTNFELINTVILQVVTGDNALLIVVELLIRSIIAFYILSVVYSFLIQQECEYRIYRRESTQIQNHLSIESNLSDSWSN